MNKFDKELIAVLQDDKTTFAMEAFCALGSEKDFPSCETARCMAGHICGTMRPLLAAALLQEFPNRFRMNKYDFSTRNHVPGDRVNYEALANFIYKAETGKTCTLDFGGFNHPTHTLEKVTLAETVAHIRGRSKRWPRLKVTA